MRKQTTVTMTAILGAQYSRNPSGIPCDFCGIFLLISIKHPSCGWPTKSCLLESSKKSFVFVNAGACHGHEMNISITLIDIR